MISELQAYRELRNKAESIDTASYTTVQADKSMCDLLAHTAEELMELRMCINRKAWKPMASIRGTSAESVALRQQALEELADVLLMLDAFRDAAALSFEEVQQAVLDKMAKNLARQDHVCNISKLS